MSAAKGKATTEPPKAKPASDPDALFQIAALEAQVVGLEARVKEKSDRVEALVREKEALEDHVRKCEEDKLDLSAHHKRELHESELVLAAQGRKVDDLHRAVEDWRTRYEQDMQELRQRAAQRETEHAVEVEQLQEDLNALLDFRKEKEDVLKKIAQLEDTIDAERTEHRRELQEAERRVVQEKDRLRNEMKEKVAEVRQKFMKMTDEQLEENTKLTIERNEKLLNERDYLASESLKLARQNDELLAENKRLKTERSVLVQAEEEFAKRNHVAVSMFKSLAKKYKDTEQTLQAEQTIMRAERDMDSSQHDEQVQELRAQLADALLRTEQLQAEMMLASQREAVVAMEQERQRLLVNEVAEFVASFVDDMSRMIGRAREPAESRIVNDAAMTLERELQVAERERVLQFLLAKLSAFPSAAASVPLGDARVHPSRTTLASYAAGVPQPAGTVPPAPKPFGSAAGRLRPGEIVTHPIASAVRDWGSKSLTMPAQSAAGSPGKKPNPLLRSPDAKR